jgi:peptidoglycan/xylan/chitin deacetylase (PgdA/CDA1 family)
MRKLACVIWLVATSFPASAQSIWPDGKTAAIVLTYDDAMSSQLDNAVPQLAAAGLKGTFFLSGGMAPEYMRRWREVQRAGHELGNHSLFHPCPKSILPDRPLYSTDTYDVDRMLLEIAIMNSVLYGIDGQERRSYSAPCSQMLVGGVDYTDALRRTGVFKYLRTGGDPFNSLVTDFEKLDPFKVPSWGPTDSPGAAQLIAYVDRVREAHGLGVLQFHGVGGQYLSVSADAHAKLLAHLVTHPDVWVAPFSEVMDHVMAHSR